VFLEDRGSCPLNYFLDARWSREQTSVGIKERRGGILSAKSVRKEKTRGPRGKMNERGVRNKEEKEEESSSLQPLPVASSVRLVDATRCGDALLFIAVRTIKYITYDFTVALLHREHRRTPVLLPGALDRTFATRLTTFLKLHVMLICL